jgi:hypothetical protein
VVAPNLFVVRWTYRHTGGRRRCQYSSRSMSDFTRCFRLKMDLLDVDLQRA